eukprot:m.223234 g.223234  ORF g.223234 m.223234 type:complete len:416 (-) comp17026_c3_seq15:5257-6504(-)
MALSESTERLRQDFSQAYQDFLRVDGGDTTGWEYLFDVEDWRLYRRKKEGSELFEYMTHGHGREMEMRLMYQVFVDIHYVKDWHAYCKDIKAYKSETDGDAELFVVKCPFPLANREYAFTRHACQTHRDGKLVYIIVSRTALDCMTNPPKADKSNVRIPDHHQVIVIEENPQDRERPLIYMYYYDDPGGSIPSWIVNWVAKTAAPKFLSSLRKAMKGYDQWRANHGNPPPVQDPTPMEEPSVSQSSESSLSASSSIKEVDKPHEAEGQTFDLAVATYEESTEQIVSASTASQTHDQAILSSSPSVYSSSLSSSRMLSAVDLPDADDEISFSLSMSRSQTVSTQTAPTKTVTAAEIIPLQPPPPQSTLGSTVFVTPPIFRKRFIVEDRARHSSRRQDLEHGKQTIIGPVLGYLAHV